MSQAEPTSTTVDAEATKATVLEALDNVWDPELGLDIVNLGLVYDIKVADRSVVIDMTLTTPGCPVSETLPREAEAAASAALPDFDVSVEVVWDPPWTPERLTPEGLQRLGFS
ncbi:MAG: metal-sulfur cluster assembly factor [Acidimicrobiia bacterium]|nr:metal-sulfur cluster assembly factor [Acidimicrobiia bacterium]